MDLYSIIEITVSIAFFAIAGYSIISNLKKKKKKDDNKEDK